MCKCTFPSDLLMSRHRYQPEVTLNIYTIQRYSLGSLRISKILDSYPKSRRKPIKVHFLKLQYTFCGPIMIKKHIPIINSNIWGHLVVVRFNSLFCQKTCHGLVLQWKYIYLSWTDNNSIMFCKLRIKLKTFLWPIVNSWEESLPSIPAS